MTTLTTFSAALRTRHAARADTRLRPGRSRLGWVRRYKLLLAVALFFAGWPVAFVWLVGGSADAFGARGSVHHRPPAVVRAAYDDTWPTFVVSAPSRQRR